MTYEELKAVAKSMGYRLIENKPYVRFLPCKCGHNRRSLWEGYRGEESVAAFVCKGCGKRVEGANYWQAKRNWNEEMK